MSSQGDRLLRGYLSSRIVLLAIGIITPIGILVVNASAFVMRNLSAPMTNTGFNSNGQLSPATGLTSFAASTNPQTFTTPTGAYPNQLASVAIRPPR